MQKTLSFCALVLEKNFSAFCNQRLQETGLTQGLLQFLIYIGKNTNCSTGELVKVLHIDFGHGQRSIDKLVNDGFVIRKKNENDKRAYGLTLTQKGDEAFKVCHQVFFEWDEKVLQDFSIIEKEQLFYLLEKIINRKGEYDCVRNNQQRD